MKPPATLIVATDHQEHRFAAPFALLNEAISNRVFPGAALAVTLRGRLLACRGFGALTYDIGAPLVTTETLWDLASLTKPIATTSMAMLLYDRAKLSLDTPVVSLLPEFADGKDPRRETVTVRMLLAHSSGLPAHRKLYLEAAGRKAVVTLAAAVPLQWAPMERSVYSDLGFILLGELLERIASRSLDAFCEEEIFTPLKFNMSFLPQAYKKKKIPPTAIDSAYRCREIQGEVNDENASAMGGVAGHAGAFGDVLSVARFADCILMGGGPLFRAETVKLFTAQELLPPGTSRTLGWDTPSAPSQSGSQFSTNSFGHLGFTGTSLWCDPERGLSVTLLTNRTWPDSQNQAIKRVRPNVHDAIVNALDSSV